MTALNGVPSPPKKVLCAHLLDDFSGSSKVMSQVIGALNESGHKTLTLVGSHGTKGFIRTSHPVIHFKYRFEHSKVRLLISFAAAQIRLFAKTLQYCHTWKPDIVYANTVLPVGAMIAANLYRIPTIVHIHEVGLGTPALFRILLKIANRCATRIICVSQYVANSLPIKKELISILHNTLPPADKKEAERISKEQEVQRPAKPFTVLMACSPRLYKGIDSFAAIARRLQSEDINFKLIANCEPEEIRHLFASVHPPTRNIEIVCRPPSVFDHYRTAGVVVNLSHKDKCIESFGLTLIEGMSCGVPVIAPQVGGCTELFTDGKGGWLIDSRDIDSLCNKIQQLAQNQALWLEASDAAQTAAARFSSDRFANNLHKIIQATR